MPKVQGEKKIKTSGTKREVYLGLAKKTRGGLTKSGITCIVRKDKNGNEIKRYVSKKKSTMGMKRESQNGYLKMWRDAVKEASLGPGEKPSVAPKKGSVHYRNAKRIYDEKKSSMLA